MTVTDVLVIGSSAAGLVAALTAKTVNPEKNVTVVRMEKTTLVPCGIPYIFATVGSTDKNVMPSDKMFNDAGVNLIIDKVESISRAEKQCQLQSGEKISYKKLVLATGSQPYEPEWLKGYDLENVFTIPKNKEYLDAMQAKIKDCSKVVIIGAGFIGVEVSDELKKAGKEVTLVEKLPHILGLAFDEEMADRICTLLESRGVTVKAGMGVQEISGDKKVTGVLLENGETIPADAVVLAMGCKPNTFLAKEAGLPVNKQGFIKVDEYMRTEDADVLAVGDCAENRDFVTRKPTSIMLASTACAEARIAAMNLFKLSSIKTFIGTISIFSTALGETGFGVAGLNETRAKLEGFDYITGVFEGMDKHPGSLPGTQKQWVKLIVSKETGIILGGEIIGGLSAGELVNTLGFIIQSRMDLNDLLTAQIGTHPLLTASPAAYPLLKAAGNAAKKKLGL